MDELRLLRWGDPSFLILVKHELQQFLHFGGPRGVLRVDRNDVGRGVVHLNSEIFVKYEPARC